MAPETAGSWRPAATLEVLKLRARMRERIRAFFSERGVLEVETPILSTAATPDPALASFATRYTGPVYPRGQPLYLQTSPEFPMKRLVAAGSGSIYQLATVFRDGEAGRLHNPEFSLLEWYRIGFDHHQLMDETTDLVTSLLAPSLLLEPSERLTYREAFERYAAVDPHAASIRDFLAAASAHGLDIPASLRESAAENAWRDFLLIRLVEPNLGAGRLTYLYDYPASQASLARIRPETPPVAARFELYLSGIELANGFHELTDAAEQRERFDRQRRKRSARGLPDSPIDERLLAAMANGLPDCAGVALGFDRLVMLAAGARSISEVLAFPFERV